MQARSSLPTPPTPSYPMPNPTPVSNPNYNPVGTYGSSSSPNYPPAGPGGSYPNYPDQVQQQDRPYLSQNHAAYADSPQYIGYPQAGQQYPQPTSPPPPPRRRRLATTVIILLIVIVLFILP